MKRGLAVVVILFLLSACAGRSAGQGSSVSTGSGVQVYGTIDTGVGVQNMSR